MPYLTNHDLPASIRTHLPLHGQDIYRDAFNRACEMDRKTADRVAWEAVKECYEKEGDCWREKHEEDHVMT